MSSAQSARAATTYLVLGGLQRGIALILLVPLSFALAPAEFGAATLLTTTALLLTTLLASPVEQLVFRSVARGGGRSASELRVIRAYCIWVLPLVFALLAFGVAFIPEILGVNGSLWAIEILAVGLIPIVSTLALPMARARQDLARFAIVSGVNIVALAGSKLWLVVAAEWGVLGWVVSDLIAAVVTAIVAVACSRVPRAGVTRGDVGTVVGFSLPLVPHRAAFWALASASRPAMAAVGTMADVGYLSFGLSLASIASLILAELNNALLPHYSRERLPAPTNETEAVVRVQLLAAFIAPAMVGAGIGLFGTVFFGAAYWSAFSVAAILLVGQAAYGVYLIPMNYMVQTAGRPRFSAIASVSGAAVILGGIVVAGASIGVNGVAWLTVLGFGLMAILAFTLVSTQRIAIHWREFIGTWPTPVGGVLALTCGVLAASAAPASTAGITLSILTIVTVGFTAWLTRRSIHAAPPDGDALLAG